MALVNLKSRLADYRGPVNYFPDESSGAQGFTENMTQTQFTGVNGQANNYTYSYPNLVNDGRLQAQKIIPSPGQIANTSTPGAINQSNLPGINNNALTFTYPSNVKDGRLWRPDAKSQVFPGGQNFIDDLRSGAKGFTLNVNESQFLGITNGTFTYPNSVLPIHKNSVQSVPTANSKFDQGTATLDNQLGVGSKFYYLKDGALSSKLFTQFGYATSKRYNDSVQSLKGQIEKSLLAQKSIEENSPSALTEQYKKFNLQDDSFNPTGINFLPALSNFVRQPFVLRGIQRKEKPEPQRWGVDALLSLDSGLIKGGAATAAERSAVDGERLIRWITSAAGQFWVIKQVGLGLSNPQVEALGGPFTRMTRIHTGYVSLASAVGSAFGIRLDKHGLGSGDNNSIQKLLKLPNSLSRYEKVQRVKQNSQISDRIIEQKFEFGLRGNRLAHLRKELDLKNDYPNLKPGSLKNQEGTRILSLSGIGGPSSVYGIGVTDIKRYVDTKTNSLSRARSYGFEPTWTISAQYASGVSNSKFKTSIDSENLTTKAKQTDVDTNEVRKGFALSEQEKKILQAADVFTTNNAILDFQKDGRPSLQTRIDKYSDTKSTVTPGSDRSADLSSSNTITNAYPTTIPSSGIRRYSTLAYGKIPNKGFSNDKNEQIRKGDFRNLLDESLAVGKQGKEYYNTYNLESKYGFGKQGAPNNTNPQRNSNSFFEGEADFIKSDKLGTFENRFAVLNSSTFRGDKITAIDIVQKNSKDSEKYLKTEDVYPKGITDLIEFYFEDGSGPPEKSGNKTSNLIRKNVMPFRATITGLSDSFTPGWNNISIMGRPDGAYLYSSFERQLSFTFTVAATSRAEMIPMWRKLNYLASYTMPDFGDGNRPAGPMMRLTLGDMFKRCPGFLNSLTYTIPDEGVWDIADDRASSYIIPKQLPTIVEVSVGYTVIHDKRPQQNGKVYYIDNWLADAEDLTAKEKEILKNEAAAAATAQQLSNTLLGISNQNAANEYFNNLYGVDYTDENRIDPIQITSVTQPTGIPFANNTNAAFTNTNNFIGPRLP